MTGAVTIISRHFKIFIPVPPSNAPDAVCTGHPLLSHAVLQPAFGEDGLDSLHHPTQAIRAEQIYIQNAPAFEVIQHIQPEFAVFVLSNPDSQNVLPAIHGDTQHHIGCFGHVPPVFPNLIVNGVHEHKRIHRLQRAILPGCDLRHDLFTDLRHQLRRDLHAVQLLDLLSDIPLAHAAGVQCQDLILHPVRIPVILADDLGLEGAVPVPGDLDVHLTQLGLDGLLRVAIAVFLGAPSGSPERSQRSRPSSSSISTSMTVWMTSRNISFIINTNLPSIT